MNILFDDRWFGNHGIGTFSKEVAARLPEYQSISSSIPKLHPFDPLWISWEIERKKPDVYLSPGYNPPILSRVPFVFTIHDLNHLHPFENTSWLKKQYYRFVMKPACQKASAILTVSEFSKCEIIEWAGVNSDKVVNVGNAAGSRFTVNGEKYNPGYPYLFYIGNRKSHKNIYRMLEGYAKSGVHKDVHLIMTGRSDDQIEGWLKQLSLKDAVVFTGLVTDDVLPSMYRGALATLFVSLYEGFGLPVVESMACGTPVITSNVAACPEVADGAAKLVNPYDSEEIALGIREMVSDDILRKKYTEAGAIRAGNFSWNVTALKVYSALNAVG